ncbi:uncharacterized protein [Diadema antillarum]|uniref:uncharacterized protein n=1 Tax=Diadema antillarum TaxID=105358 RepID=UPI003A84F147
MTSTSSTSSVDVVRRAVIFLCGTAGFAIGGAALVRYLRAWLRRVVAGNLEQKIEDAIPNHALAELAKSSNVGLRQSAEQMLLDRITKRDTFLYVVSRCGSSDEETALKSCTALCVILKSVDQRVFRVELFILQTLVSALCRSMDREQHFSTHMSDIDFPERMQRMTLATIYDLSNDPAFLSKLEQLKNRDLGSVVLELLQSSRNKEVQRYSLLLLLQMTMQGKSCGSLEAFTVVAKKCVCHHGDIMLQKICFQLLVTMINAQNSDATVYIHEIARQRIIVPMVVSTKSEDVEISFWAVALLHEFAVHHVYRKELCSLPYLIKNLQTTLMSSEAGVQRLILRVLAFLALRNDPFKADLLKNKALLGHFPTCLASGNRDVVHWALVLVHDLAVLGKQSLETLLDGTNDVLIKSLLSLSSSRDSVMIRLLAETLGLFCGCEQLHHRLVRAGSLEMILELAQSHDADLVFWASALLLNLAMTSDAVKAEILSCGGLKTLVDLSLGDHDNNQITTMAAKTLVMMAVLDDPIHIHARCESDAASVIIHKKTLQLTHTGVSVVLWETLLDKRLQVWHFSPSETEEHPDTSRLVHIPILEQQSSRTSMCNIVIFAINGKHAPACLRALKGTLHFGNYSTSGFVTPDPLDLEEGHSCCIFTMVDVNGRNDVMHLSKSQDTVDINLQLSGATIVSQRIRQLILLPLLHRILGVPANSPINRISDLELMEVLVQHQDQKKLVLECHAVMDQLTAMVFYFAQQGFEQLKSEPLAVSHSHGALRVLRVLSMFDHYRPVLLTSDTVPAVVKLLNGLVNYWLNAILSTQSHGGGRPVTRLTASRPVSRADVRPGDTSEFLSYFPSRPQSRGMPTAYGLGDEELSEVELGSTTDSLIQTESNIAQAVSAITNTLQQLAAEQPQPRNRRLRSSSDSVSIATATNLAAEVEDTEDRSEEGQMTNHLSKFAVLTLAHLLNTDDEDLSRAVQSSLHLSGALHALWAVLLCSSEQLKLSLTMPASVAMTKLAATELPPLPDAYVCLDVMSRTPSLLVSADHLEVRNDSWTFESILARTSLPVPRKHKKKPAGWYYEVELKSSGIIQIGWATKKCDFGPEKGVGVGDDLHSCAFDGARCRKWNGPITETSSNEYGLEWQVGDVVSCLMDHRGNASFWLRGGNMGEAFQGLDLSEKWFPACSLSTDQQVRFNFGDSPFRYGDVIPEGYVPFCQAHRRVRHPGREATSNHSKQHHTSDVKTTPHHHSDRHQAVRPHHPHVDLQESLKALDAGCGDVVEDPLGGGEAVADDFGYPEMGGEAFAEITDSPRHIALAKIAEVDASLQRESATEIGDRLPFRHDPIGNSLASGSGDFSGPMGLLGLMDAEGGGEAEEFQPPPSLYFEVSISHVNQRPVVMGYCNLDASVQVCAVFTDDGELLMPDQSKQKMAKHPTVTIGCALLSPPGVVFFTVNGQPIRKLFTVANEDQPSQPLTPCTNNPYLNINFGQSAFLYGPANDFDQKLYMAALLHDNCEHIMNTGHAEGKVS